MIYKLTIQTRIRVAFIVIIVLAVASTGWGSYWIAADMAETNAVKSGQDTINKSKQVMDEKLRQIAVSVMTLMISDAFKDTMRDVSLGDASGYHTHLTSLQPFFAQIKLNEPLLQTMLVSTPIGDFYNTGSIRNSAVAFVGSEPYRKLKEAKTNLWLGGHEDPFFAGGERVISLLMEPITDISVSDVYLVVNIRESGLLDLMKANLGDSQEEILLVAPDGSEVLQSDPSLWQRIRQSYAPVPRDAANVTGRLTAVDAKDEYIVNYAKLSMSEGWTLIGIQRKSDLLKQMNRIKWLVLSVAAGCTVLALLISRALMILFMKPLQNLKELMRRVESNDLSVRFESKYPDEISRVGIRFNRMLEQIVGLIETVKEAEKEKRKAEVRALQAQISPHFLYNTLNAIYWRAQLGQNEDVGEMVLGLSRLFKLALNSGNEMTTVGKEVAHVEQYLQLQQRCYEGLFAYDIFMEDKALESLPILKLMLQPLVENSIMHGFQNRRSGGTVRIRIEREQGHLRLAVSDNGKGMDAESVMRAVRAPAGGESAANSKSYALRNIYNRLQLYYGSASSMTIRSEPDAETTVTLLIPLAKGEQS
jgi:two-component system sensor histidine kinase YesM